MVASEGQILIILWRAVCLFRALKAFLASTRRTASVSSFWKVDRTAWTAASVPEGCPAHSWCEPAASRTSHRTIDSTALAMIRLAVWHTPIGRTPGFLLMAMRRQARKAHETGHPQGLPHYSDLSHG